MKGTNHMLNNIREILHTYVTLHEMPEEGSIMSFSFVNNDTPSELDLIEYTGYFKFDEYLDVCIYNAIRDQFPHVKKITGVIDQAHKHPNELDIFTTCQVPLFFG